MRVLFGDRLKEIRLQHKMSQEEFATLLGTSKQVISRYETNQRTPKLTIVQDYANQLGVSINFLINNNATSKTKSEPKKDISVIIGRLKEQLSQGNLTFKGKPVSDEKALSLINGIQIAVEITLQEK